MKTPDQLAAQTLARYKALPEELAHLDAGVQLFLIKEQHSLKAVDACLEMLRQSATRVHSELQKLPDNLDLQAAMKWALQSLEELESAKTLLVQKAMADRKGELH